MNNIRVAIWGFGAMGSGMGRMLLDKQGIEIAAVCDRAETRVGHEVHDLLSVDRRNRPQVIITQDPVQAFPEGIADVLLLATDSTTRDAYDKIIFGLEQGMNVISTAEELAYPKAQEPGLAQDIDESARQYGASVLGTGINPGFVLDYLILALTGACERVDHIKAARINDLSPFGPSVMQEQGVGTNVEDFNRGVADGSIVGHVGFPESISMVAEGIGWKLDKVEETREAIVSSASCKTAYAEVTAGQVAGCRQCGSGYVDGEEKIVMEHPQRILPHLDGIETGDQIAISGVPDITMRIEPEIPGGIGTIAMCVNMIPQVINADPGLKTMLDLPVPRAVMGDFRDRVDQHKRPHQ